jgi:hypothetical protein
MIGGQRRRQQPRRKLPIKSSGQWAQPQCGFNLKDVLPAGLITFGVVAETRCIDAQLLSDEGAQRSGWLLTLLKYSPWKMQLAADSSEENSLSVAM